MKATLLVVAALATATILGTRPADAQIVRSYGLSAAVTSTGVRSPELTIPGAGTVDFETQRRIGVGLSAFIEWNAVEQLSIVTGAGYTQRGYQTEFEIRDEHNMQLGTGTTGERLDFLALDAAFKLRHEFGGVTPFVLAGPELRLNIGGEGSLTEFQSDTAFGAVTGLGVEIPTATTVGLQAEIRYAFDVSNSLPDVARDLYHNAIDLRVGVRF